MARECARACVWVIACVFYMCTRTFQHVQAMALVLECAARSEQVWRLCIRSSSLPLHLNADLYADLYAVFALGCVVWHHLRLPRRGRLSCLIR